MSHLYRRGRVFWYKAYRDGRLVRLSLKTANRRVAQFKKAEFDLKYGRARGRELEEGVMFLQAATRFLEATRTLRSPSWHQTLTKYFTILDQALGRPSLYAVRPVDLEQAINRIAAERDLRPKSRNDYLAAARMLSRWCVEHGLSLDDFTRGIKRQERGEAERTWLSREQRDDVLKRAEQSPGFLVVLAAFYTGLRWKELASLSWEDVAFDRKTLLVRPQHAKSRRARAVSLHPRLEAVLRPLRRKSGPIFPIQGRLAYHAHLKALQRWFKQSGIRGDRLGFHTCRHTFVSLLLQRQVPLWDVAGWAGHADARITQERYAHRAPAYNPAIEQL